MLREYSVNKQLVATIALAEDLEPSLAVRTAASMFVVGDYASVSALAVAAPFRLCQHPPADRLTLHYDKTSCAVTFKLSWSRRVGDVLARAWRV